MQNGVVVSTRGGDVFTLFPGSIAFQGGGAAAALWAVRGSAHFDTSPAAEELEA